MSPQYVCARWVHERWLSRRVCFASLADYRSARRPLPRLRYLISRRRCSTIRYLRLHAHCFAADAGRSETTIFSPPAYICRRERRLMIIAGANADALGLRDALTPPPPYFACVPLDSASIRPSIGCRRARLTRALSTIHVIGGISGLADGFSISSPTPTTACLQNYSRNDVERHCFA